MTDSNPVPQLITFDGEARSGKGTIVQACKDYLRDELGRNVMLIDGGQVFRCLVVAASNAGVDVDDPNAIDEFLGNDQSAEDCVRFVKDVYRMPKVQREELLYTNQVGADSAKIGARPLSQSFKDELLKKWLRDARAEGFDTVLLDGRALEETGTMLEGLGLCTFIAGFYFICDPEVGARRTFGHAARRYDELTSEERADVDLLITQINARNAADRDRKVQPIVRPNGPLIELPHDYTPKQIDGRFMATIDTSADMTKEQMYLPITMLLRTILKQV